MSYIGGKLLLGPFESRCNSMANHRSMLKIIRTIPVSFSLITGKNSLETDVSILFCWSEMGPSLKHQQNEYKEASAVL